MDRGQSVDPNAIGPGIYFTSDIMQAKGMHTQKVIKIVDEQQYKMTENAINDVVNGLSPHDVISGAIFDFAGYMTTRNKTIPVGAKADASPVANMVKNWANKRVLNIDSANVTNWQNALERAITGEDISDILDEITTTGLVPGLPKPMGVVKSIRKKKVNEESIDFVRPGELIISKERKSKLWRETEISAPHRLLSHLATPKAIISAPLSAKIDDKEFSVIIHSTDGKTGRSVDKEVDSGSTKREAMETARYYVLKLSNELINNMNKEQRNESMVNEMVKVTNKDLDAIKTVLSEIQKLQRKLAPHRGVQLIKGSNVWYFLDGAEKYAQQDMKEIKAIIKDQENK